MVKQLFATCIDELRLRIQTPPLRRHPPDPSVPAVAARVAEIDFAVVDDRVGPVGDVKGAVRAELDVDGAEIRLVAAEQVAHLAGDVAGAVLLDLEPHDAIRPEVAGDHVALPVVREMLTVDDLQAAE